MLGKLRKIFNTDNKIQITLFGKDMYLDFSTTIICRGKEMRIETDWQDGYRIYAGNASFDICNVYRYKLVESSKNSYEIRSKEEDNIMLFISVWGDEL